MIVPYFLFLAVYDRAPRYVRSHPPDYRRVARSFRRPPPIITGEDSP